MTADANQAAQPWEPEQTVGAELAQALIAEQFPQLAPVRLVAYGSGWDNTAYLVNDEFVFRFPRRAIAVPLLRTEARVLPTIAKHLQIQISAPVFVGQPSERFEWPFTGAREIPGQTACRARLSGDQRSQLVPALVEFMASLHSLTPAQVPGVGGDTFGRNDLRKRIDHAHARLGDAVDRGLIDDPRVFAAIIEAVPRDVVFRNDILVHGDLYARHLIVQTSIEDRRTELAGIIDWGDVHRGDPYLDLALAHSLLPTAARQAFWRGYEAKRGPVSQDTWKLARFRSLYSSLMIAVYGNDINDRALVDEGLWGLQNLVDARD